MDSGHSPHRAPRIAHFTASDGYRFAVRVWDTQQPIGRIVFVHGIISHGGWYRRSCRYLAERGFDVHFLDRRGSGLNLEDRGDVPHWHIWLDDVEQYVRSLPAARANILLGISWGGKFATAFARQRPALFDAFGLLCPGLFARQIPGPAKYLGLSLAGAVGLQSLRLTIPLQDHALFTDSPDWQTYIARDPLTLRKVTVRFALADRALTRFAIAAPEEIHAPVLLMLAGRDQIVDNRRTRAFLARIGCRDKTVIEYASAAHTLEFEPDPSPYFAELTNWAIRMSTTSARP